MKKEGKNRIVMVFGTFDILHNGHFDFLEQAKEKGKYLIVIIARDKNVKQIKGNLPDHNETVRKHIVNHIPVVDKAILGSLKDKYLAIKKYRPDVICLGYDQRVDLKELKNKLKKFKLKTKIYRLKSHHPKIYKSSRLKNSRIISLR
jgi:FAD synthetase